MSDLQVIGAGVAGLAIATEIAARGGNIHLVDTHPGPGPHACSWWAGGMLAPYCERESAEEPVLRLGLEAANWWQDKTGAVIQNGSLVLTLNRDKSDMRRFARRTSGFQEVDADAIAKLEPDLAGRFQSGLFFSEEAHLNPRAALNALKQRLSDSSVNVSSVRKPSANTIDCRGLAAADVLKDMRGVKGEMLVIKCPDVSLTRPIRLLHPRIPLYIVPRGDGVFMLGATMIESSERTRITARSMLELLSAAYALHPAFGEAEILEIGVDARPAFPDNLPRIRKCGDTLYANGLYRHGFLLAPALAQQVADYVLEGKTPEFYDESHR